jgi:hypothetical protein
MRIPIRTGVGLLLCGGLASCALAPAVLLPQVAMTAGVAGMTAIACGGDPLCGAEVSPCMDPAGKDIAVVVRPGVTIPDGEGSVAVFTPAYWQPQFESADTSRGSRAADAAPGTFVVTGKSVLFVPRGNLDGIRVPLAAITTVEMQRNESSAPRQLTVESCFGRLDRFTFGQPQRPDRLDSTATTAAAAELKARVAATRPAKKKKEDEVE